MHHGVHCDHHWVVRDAPPAGVVRVVAVWGDVGEGVSGSKRVAIGGGDVQQRIGERHNVIPKERQLLRATCSVSGKRKRKKNSRG